jgi:hypothetical protein
MQAAMTNRFSATRYIVVRSGSRTDPPPSEPRCGLHIWRMASPMEDMKKMAAFRKCEVFGQHVMDFNRRILVAADDAAFFLDRYDLHRH